MFLVSKHLWGWADSPCCVPPKVSISLTTATILLSVFMDSPHLNPDIIVRFIVLMRFIDNRYFSHYNYSFLTTYLLIQYLCKLGCSHKVCSGSAVAALHRGRPPEPPVNNGDPPSVGV